MRKEVILKANNLKFIIKRLKNYIAYFLHYPIKMTTKYLKLIMFNTLVNLTDRPVFL